MNNDQPLASSLTSSQSESSDRSSTGNQWNNGISRRRFLKRTGGATVGTLIMWNLSSIQSQAEVTEAGSSGNTWKIKSSKVSVEDSSSGTPQDWDYQGITYTVRETLIMTAEASETEYAGSATCTISVTVTKSAEVMNNGAYIAIDSPTGVPVGMGNAWNGGEPPKNQFDASIEKSINSETGEITEGDKTANGETEGEPAYDPTSSENGISLKTKWNEDTLEITFGGVGFAENSKNAEATFLKKKV